MRQDQKGIGKIITDVGNSCPYTIIGKKVIAIAKGEKPLKIKELKEKEQKLLQQIRTGRNIALIGVFCPIFWVSFLSGAPRNQVLFNLFHSSIVILIGIAVMIVGKINLKKILQSKYY